jgi:HD-like signal output (HDOD) protein
MGIWAPVRRLIGAVAEPSTRGVAATARPRAAGRSAGGVAPATTWSGISDVRAITADSLREDVIAALGRFDRGLEHQRRTPDLLELVADLSSNPTSGIRQLPGTAQRVMAACDNPDLPTPSLVDLLETDPSLAQAVLSRANSAFYSRTDEPCVALSEAIVRMGRRGVQNAMLQQVLTRLVCRPGGEFDAMVGQVRSHMVRAAPIARALASAFDVDPEQAFTLALLHDIGKLAVFDRIAAHRSASRHAIQIPKPALTLVLLVVHQPLGGLCALQWDLGDAAAAAVAAHHRQPIPRPRSALTEVIWLAERLDLLEQRHQPVSLDELWRQGEIGGDLPEARRALALLKAEAA